MIALPQLGGQLAQAQPRQQQQQQQQPLPQAKIHHKPQSSWKHKQRTKRRRKWPPSAGRSKVMSPVSSRLFPVGANSSRRLVLLVALLVGLLAPAAAQTVEPQTRSNNSQPQNTQADLAANFVAALLKSYRISACDGEQLDIRCNDNYVIDISAIAFTILKEHHSQWADDDGHGDNSADARGPELSRLAGNASQLLPNGLTNQQQPRHANGRKFICKPTEWKRQLAGATKFERQNSNLSAAWPGKQEVADADGGQQSAATISREPSAANQALASGNATATPAVAAAVAAASGYCDDKTTDEAASSEQSYVAGLIRKLCQSQAKCSLGPADWWPASVQPEGTNASAEAPLIESPAVGRSCARHRRRLELEYMCRPLKIGRRAVCRGQQLALECPADRKLVFTSADYGASPAERKLHDRCLMDQLTSRAHTQRPVVVVSQPVGQSAQGSASTPTSAAPTTTLPDLPPSACLSNRTLDTLLLNCAFKRECRLEVSGRVFGDTSCPANQPEYLVLIYACVPADYLNDTQAQTLLRHRHSLYKSDIYIAPVVKTAPAAPTTRHPPVQPGTPPGEPGDARDDHHHHFVVPPPLPPPPPPATTTSANRNSAANSSRLQSLVAADPQLASTHPSLWSANQKLRFFWLQYRVEVMGVALVCAFVLVAVGLVRACASSGSPTPSLLARKGGASSSMGSSSKSDAGSSSSSSSAHSKSSFGLSCSSPLTSSAQNAIANAYTSVSQHNQRRLGAGGAINQRATAKHHQQQLNSCNESCFSLDDSANFTPLTAASQPNQNLNSAANSPALNSTSVTPLDGHQHQHYGEPVAAPAQAAAHFNYGTGARPKLWSIYNNEQRAPPAQLHVGQLQLAHSTTLRPTRTFVGARPQPPLCGHAQLASMAGGAVGGGQLDSFAQHQAAGVGISHAADLLLAMASGKLHEQQQHQHQQLQQQHQLSSSTGQRVNWTTASATNTLSPNELQGNQQQHAHAHCAFHQQQVGGASSNSIAPAPVQLEPLAPQLALANLQHQAQQPPPPSSSSSHQQHQQQQASLFSQQQQLVGASQLATLDQLNTNVAHLML